MMEPTLTAEDLTLYAMDLLDGDARAQVEAVLRKSTAAREEFSRILGDLALFAFATEQHTPQAMTRQRLLQQVARERRTVPLQLPVVDEGAIASEQQFDARMSKDRASEMPQFSRIQKDATKGGQPVAIPGQLRPPSSPAQERVAAAPQATQPPMEGVTPKPQSTTWETENPEDDKTDVQVAPVSFTADRQRFSPDPEVYPREARALSTSATAHSVTMFEQHFASESVSLGAGPTGGPKKNSRPGSSRNAMDDALAGVQDRFVPSAGEPGRPEAQFALSSYRDPDTVAAQPDALGRWVGWSGWAVAAVFAVAALASIRDDFRLREQVSRLQTQMSQAQANALRAQKVTQTLESPAAQHFLLARTDAAPAPTGRVAYLPEHGSLVFQANNLQALQPYKTYELWLIPSGEDRQPVPAGLFKPDEHGYATVVLPEITKGLIAGNFGVTIEDEGGSTTPTLPILLVGQQS